MGGTTVCAAPASQSLPAAPIRFSTSDYSPRERLAAWHEIYGQTMVKVDIEPIETEAFDIDIRMRRLPGLSIMTGSRSAAVYQRTPRHIDCDDLVISLGLAGPFEVSQSGRTASMARGDAVMLISGEPGRVTVPSNGRWINLCVPQRAVPGLSANFCKRVPAENSALRLLTGYVNVLEATDTLATPELQRHAVTHIHDLIALALGATRDATEVAKVRGARAARLRAVKADIVDNLGRVDISVAAVAARHHLPVRSLQRLFEADGGTFTDFVLDTRLARARRMLIDPRLNSLKITAIAAEAGFGDMSYFNQSFRRRYGATPSDARARIADS
jgi:AraC-like DNA-binding protein